MKQTLCQQPTTPDYWGLGVSERIKGLERRLVLGLGDERKYSGPVEGPSTQSFCDLYSGHGVTDIDVFCQGRPPEGMAEEEGDDELFEALTAPKEPMTDKEFRKAQRQFPVPRYSYRMSDAERKFFERKYFHVTI